MKDSIGRILERIDGRGYKAYKDLVGASERIGGVRVRVTRVQGDPFAPPSVVMVDAPLGDNPLYHEWPIPVADYALRLAYRLSAKYSIRGAGEGHSGEVRVPRPGPVILRRSAAGIITGSRGGVVLRLRLWVGLPSRRRRVLGNVARELLLSRLPRLAVEVARGLERGEARLERHVDAWREQEFIRERLPSMGLVSFIGDGSILPRACGGCEEPLEGAVPFESPESLRVELELPTGRSVTGMGVREGLTLVAGPAFHGKTTLMEAIASGVWDHVPGDGRELVVTRRDAFWVQSENGRWVSCVDVSPWVESMPGLRDPYCWSTSDASGATSAVASLQEAVEAGSRLILIDEDWTATNFIHRDRWTEEVTGKRTLLSVSDLAPALKKAGISIVIVASGSIPLLASADTVIVMDEYKPRDATSYAEKARRVAVEAGLAPAGTSYTPPSRRRLVEAFTLVKPKLRGRILEARNLRDTVDLSGLRQLEEQAQLNTLLPIAQRLTSRPGVLVAEAKRMEEDIRRGEWESIDRNPGPGLSEVRWLDVLYLVNRLPGLRVARG